MLKISFALMLLCGVYLWWLLRELDADEIVLESPSLPEGGFCCSRALAPAKAPAAIPTPPPTPGQLAALESAERYREFWESHG